MVDWFIPASAYIYTHIPTRMFTVDGFSKRDPVRAEREFRAGIAEIIKTGAIWDLSLFEVCEQKVEMIQVSLHDALDIISQLSLLPRNQGAESQ